VPAAAVVQRGQLEIVFVVANQNAQLRLAKTGRRFGDTVEILSGLDADDSVVVDGADRLSDGQPVEARRSEIGITDTEGRDGVAGRIARAFIDSKLTPLVVITSVLLGVAAIFLLPREEEPQIKVPMIDVLVAMPGFSAKEVEERATRPMEKLLWEIPGVEYIYSTSRPGESLAIVRFKVGEDVEKSLVKLNQKLQSNFDRIPQGVSQPLIKPRSIDITHPGPDLLTPALKRPGANAISVAHQVLKKVDTLKGRTIPNDVEITITRNYGETAAEKSNELLWHMGIAVVGVSLLILVTLGWREAGIVAIAIPTTLALTVLVFYLYGYTLNRITLFALIFSIGILVDDAIVVVENIVRHFHLPQNKGRNWSSIAVEAVNEVGNPTILATFAVIAAVLPMAFVGGLSGPYMRPTPLGAGVAMFFSLGIAFVVTPWASIRILRWGKKYSALTGRTARVVESGGSRIAF
jgi:multidrug efflux pump subunit AcrB